MRRAISAIIISLLISTMPITAFAKKDWQTLYEEQCIVNMPELKLYFYPLDEDMRVVPDVSLINTQVTATLGEENLEIESIESIKTEGTTYIIGVNCSAQLTGYGCLSNIKQGLCYWLETMGNKDRMILFYYTDKQSLLLDGTETRIAAGNGISTIATDTAKPDTLAAIRYAIQLKQGSREDFPSRHVCILFDDGNFATENEYTLDSLQETLRMEGMPIHIVCHKSFNAEEVLAFTQSIGGITVETNRYDIETKMMELHSVLENAYVLQMRAANNRLEPKVRKLKVEMKWNDEVYTLEKNQRISHSIPDTVSPVLGKVFLQEQNRLVMEVSEDVTGANDRSNYRLIKDNHEEIEISEASYDAEKLEITLLLEKALEEGDYKLSLQNITDNSQEKNPVIYENDSDAVMLSYRLWEAETSKGILISDEAPLKSAEEPAAEPELPKKNSNGILWACGGGVVVFVLALVVVLCMRKKKNGQGGEQKQTEASEDEKSGTIFRDRTVAPEWTPDDRTVAPEWTPDEENNDVTRPMLSDESMTRIEWRVVEAVFRITMEDGETRNEKINISTSGRDTFIVGRSAKSCSLVVNDRTMSGRHFSLSATDRELIVQDLESTNGTFINGIRIEHPQPLRDGDTICAGKTKIEVHYKEQ